jgi:putative transposase
MSTKHYPSDLSDAEWRRLQPYVPAPKPGGRPAKYERRAILNAIFYLVRGGVSWRMLPTNLPPWRLVYHYFRQWTRDGWWEKIHAILRAKVREKAGRKPQPSAGVLDSQTVSCLAPAGERGYDAGKKTNGRKRHIVVDTMGLLWLLVVHPAHIQDRDGAKLVLARLAFGLFRWRLLWADAAYAGALESWVATLRVSRPGVCPLRLEIVRRSEGAKGWQLLPKRWIVERTFGWLSRSRRLARDYETNLQHSQSMITIAMIHLMLRRISNQATF